MPIDPVRFGRLRTECERRGYWFLPLDRPHPYDLFVYGIRAPAWHSNLFDDTVGVAYVAEDGTPVVEEWPATTDPGRAALDHPTREAGTATVVAGQWRRVWTAGAHKGQYPCLVPTPTAVIPVYRGTERDRIYLDSTGIQLHHAHGAKRVDWYSAGCQVLQRPEDLDRVMQLYGAQVRRGLGRLVSYTLFELVTSPALAR